MSDSGNTSEGFGLHRMPAQLVLGLKALALCIPVSLAIGLSFSPLVFTTWVSLFTISATPSLIVLGVVWEGEYPPFLKKYGQPLKGLVMTGMAALAGVIVMFLTLAAVGGGIVPPTPFPIFFAIMSVAVALWVVIVFESWPVGALSPHPLALGAGVLALTYGATYLVYLLFLDFGFLYAEPFYEPALDPEGVFPAWPALTFVVTTATVTMALAALDFWPSAAIVRHLPGLRRQPFLGMTRAVLVLVCSALWMAVMILAAGMEVVPFLVKGAVSVLFGLFIMMNLLQNAPFHSLAQPWRGVFVILASLLLALVLYPLYAFFCQFVFAMQPEVAPAYGLELWVASAMLAVTFQIIVIFSGFLGFWPLRSGH